MRRPMMTALLLLLLALALPARAADQMSPEDEAIYKSMMKSSGMDAEAMTRAMAAAQAPALKGTVYSYHIVGTYQEKTNIVGGSNWIGHADVSDQVTIDLSWDLSQAKLVGKPAFKNSKSSVKNPRNPEPKCSPPVPKGAYEHWDVLGVKDGLGGALELTVRTDFPVVEVAQMCTGARKTVPASQVKRPETMAVPSPVNGKKAMTVKSEGWTWVFTATPTGK